MSEIVETKKAYRIGHMIVNHTSKTQLELIKLPIEEIYIPTDYDVDSENYDNGQLYFERNYKNGERIWKKV